MAGLSLAGAVLPPTGIERYNSVLVPRGDPDLSLAQL